MKKFALLTVLSALLFGCFSVFASASGFGTASAVISSEVSMIKAGIYGGRIDFSESDFKCALCTPTLDSVKITSLPSRDEGTLLLGDRQVKEGEEIKRRHLSRLSFIPKSPDVSVASFLFSVDSGAEIVCNIRFTDKLNYAPRDKTEIRSLSTYEDVSLHIGLYAEDPEADTLEYIIVSYPKNGRLDELGGGGLVYTPRDGYRGRDSISYVVRDEWGNYTSPATISLAVHARPTTQEYEDMEGRREYNASLAMTALGVMGGKIVGDKSYFCPDEEITRAELVAMLLKSKGIKPTDGGETFFDDDGDIPRALVGYILTAERLGIIGGEFENGELLFKPNETVTKYECAKIISSLLGENESGEEEVFLTDDGVPVWARGSVCHMRTIGVFDADEGGLSEAVTRADAAEYLYRLIK